jgi:hypothetical protein
MHMDMVINEAAHSLVAMLDIRGHSALISVYYR